MEPVVVSVGRTERSLRDDGRGGRGWFLSKFSLPSGAVGSIGTGGGCDGPNDVDGYNIDCGIGFV